MNVHLKQWSRYVLFCCLHRSSNFFLYCEAFLSNCKKSKLLVGSISNPTCDEVIIIFLEETCDFELFVMVLNAYVCAGNSQEYASSYTNYRSLIARALAVDIRSSYRKQKLATSGLYHFISSFLCIIMAVQ